MRRDVALMVLGSCAVGCGRIAFDELADANADAGVVPRCGGPLAYSDSFDDGVTAPFWRVRADPGVTVAEAGGELVITMPMPVTTSTYGWYWTTRSIDLRDTRTYVEVPQVLGPIDGSTLLTVMASNGTDYLTMGEKLGKFGVRNVVN